MNIEDNINERIKGCDIILNEDCTRIKEIMDKPNDEILANQDTIVELNQLASEIKTVAYTKFILRTKILKEENENNETETAV